MHRARLDSVSRLQEAVHLNGVIRPSANLGGRLAGSQESTTDAWERVGTLWNVAESRPDLEGCFRIVGDWWIWKRIPVIAHGLDSSVVRLHWIGIRIPCLSPP
jgi:hypothetical protein